MATNAVRDTVTRRQIRPEFFSLSPRERQILEILYLRGEATGREILTSLPDAPSYSAVRATLRILERKRIIKHKENALRYVFFPAIKREQARRSALHHIASVFFDDSIEDIVFTLLDIFPERATLSRLARLLASFEKPR